MQKKSEAARRTDQSTKGRTVEVVALQPQPLALIVAPEFAYAVATGNLNKAVDRNIDCFPDDFMICLTSEEFRNLKFHFGTSSWGGTRKPPRAFTEQGVAMLSSVLQSKRAVHVNIEIMRAFVRLRQMLASNAGLEQKLCDLERKYDAQFKVVFDAIRQLMAPVETKRRKIGFIWDEK